MQRIKIKKTKQILAVVTEGRGKILDFNKSIDELYTYLYSSLEFKSKINGPLIGLFYSEFGGKYKAAVPIKEKIPVKGKIKIDLLPEQKCVCTIHKGSYRTIEEAFRRLKAYLKEKNLKLRFPVREVYTKINRKRRKLSYRDSNPHLIELTNASF